MTLLSVQCSEIMTVATVGPMTVATTRMLEAHSERPLAPGSRIHNPAVTLNPGRSQLSALSCEEQGTGL